MIKILKLTLTAFGGLFLLIVSFHSLRTSNPTGKIVIPVTQSAPPATPVLFEETPDIDDLTLQDNPDLYENDDPTSVVVMYITVRKGDAADNTNYTWAEVNAFNKWIEGSRSADLVVGKADVILQIGDENGPLPGEVGDDAVVPNATIQIRGASSSAMPQKSYKIELKKDAGRWRGQSTISLNKHIFDLTRVRNKLNFDLMKQIPNLISLRTQFVHLYVKDQTTDQWATHFVDYGFFTQVEQVNRRFLENHLLDRNGQLYKATSFDFNRFPDELRTVDDPLYDEDAFSNKLEIKGNRDHSKLIKMLDDINNFSIPIEVSFKRYFDVDNYFTWLAYNILVGNVDTQNQNFFLYSPLNSNKWYILPWDYDDTLFRQHREEFGEYPYQEWETGIANYWGSPLHNRILRVEKYQRMLDDQIKELLQFLTPERISGMLSAYRAVAEPFAFRSPDNTYLPGTRAEYDLQYSLLPSEIQHNYELYLDSLGRPMPFYLGIPEVNEDVLRFTWDEAFNFEPHNLTYHFQISDDVNFRHIVYEKDIINLTTAETEIFEPGTYYWYVTATNEDGKIQYAFDSYFDAESHPHNGIKSFSITPEGQIQEN